jgi:hypothetical protein
MRDGEARFGVMASLLRIPLPRACPEMSAQHVGLKAKAECCRHSSARMAMVEMHRRSKGIAVCKPGASATRETLSGLVQRVSLGGSSLRPELELELWSYGAVYCYTTFIRAITSLPQIRQVARLRSTTSNLQGLSSLSPTQSWSYGAGPG